jgi:hypothetical protein
MDRWRWVIAGVIVALVVGGFVRALVSILPYPPTSDERARAASLAEADRPFLDDMVAEALDEMGVVISSVNYDHVTECFTDQMVPTGSMVGYSKVLSTGTNESSTMLQTAHGYLKRLRQDRFEGRGDLSDPADLEPPRRRASLYVDQFSISFADEGVDGFRVEVSGPCRTADA